MELACVGRRAGPGLWLAVLLGACGARTPHGADAAPSADAVDEAEWDGLSGSTATRPDGSCVRNAFVRDGACTCQEGLPSVCGDECVDLQNDDRSCGRCGNACAPGAPCAAGVCGSVPTVFRPARTAPCKAMDLALSGDTLFWADQAAGTIESEPTAGGAPSTIATGEDAPFAVAARGATVFWLGGAPSPPQAAVAAFVRAAPSAGGSARTVVMPAGGLGGFAPSPDGSSVYFSTGVSVAKVPAAGGAAITVAETVDEPIGGVAADSGWVAFTTAPSGSHVYSAQLVDGAVARCAFDSTVRVRCNYTGKQVAGTFVVMGNAGVYWLDEGFIKFNDGADGFSYQTIDPGFVRVAALAVSSSELVYADQGDAVADGVVGELGLSPDAAPVRLARGQRAPGSVVADETRVYWSTVDCAILSHAR